MWDSHQSAIYIIALIHHILGPVHSGFEPSRAASRRVAARLGSAHARIFRGCMTCIMGVGL